MDKRLAVLCLVASLSLCYGDFTFSSTQNISLSVINENGWDWKDLEYFVVNLPTVLLSNFKNAEVTTGGNTASADAVAGAAYVFLGGFPFCYVAHFAASASWSWDGGPNSDSANLDVSASAGYVGSAFLYLEERDPSGKLIDLRSLKWVLDVITDEGLSYDIGDQSSANAIPQYVTFEGDSNDDSDNLEVDFSFIVSPVAGILTDGTKITPRSLESYIDIKNYPYASSDNHLNLLFAVGTGSAEVTGDGNVIRSGDGGVYGSFSRSVLVNGNKQGVVINQVIDYKASDINNNDFTSQLSGKYGAKANIKLVNVSFPAGASQIRYDPTIGMGATAETAAAASLAPLLSAMSLVFIISLLV